MDIVREKKPNRRRFLYIGVAVAALALTTLGLARLKPAAPTVDGGTIWRDTVKLGPMVREVRGPGTLVPEHIRWVSAVAPGRVEQKLVQPGEHVTANTILLELSNPDVQIQLLQAERQLTDAQAQLVSLKTQLETQKLTQAGVVAQVESDYRDAVRQAASDSALMVQDLISAADYARSRDKAVAMTTRLGVEKQQLQIYTDNIASQLAVQEEQIQRLKAVAEFQRGLVNAMVVRAGADGVLQELPLEVGQWAISGATLAKVVQPEKLKAVLRIPETQARDVSLGQLALIDTRNGIVKGHVIRQDPASQNGTVAVDVGFDEPLPKGARPDLSVDGTIEIERLDRVLHMGRPAYGQANSTVGLFRILPSGDEAERVRVELGRSSVNTIEVVRGLKEGDVVILSDMSRWDGVDRVRIK
ncbi:MAG TPA: HlyD family efflux transporter periplasmic adaptor subunit [Gemmatimonadales bacterium]|nr:HlyD family efflux transporter periplasmic adaptor subunit [Gemmatimonadales bacterium]